MSDLRTTLFRDGNLGGNLPQGTLKNENKTKYHPNTTHKRKSIIMTTLTITGNLVADPELKIISSGKAVASFTVVSSKSSKLPDGTWENTDTTFWNIKCWNKLAENVVESLRKGMAVVVLGSAVQEEWSDKATGEKKSKIAVTAWSVGADLKRHSYHVPIIERQSAQFPSAKVETDPWSVPFDTKKDVAPF